MEAVDDIEDDAEDVGICNGRVKTDALGQEHDEHALQESREDIDKH